MHFHRQARKWDAEQTAAKYKRIVNKQRRFAAPAADIVRTHHPTPPVQMRADPGRAGLWVLGSHAGTTCCC